MWIQYFISQKKNLRGTVYTCHAAMTSLKQVLIIRIQLCYATNADMVIESAQMPLVNCSDIEDLPLRHNDRCIIYAIVV